MRGRSLPNTPGTGRFKRESSKWYHEISILGTGQSYDSATETTYDDEDTSFEGTTVTP